MRILAITNMYPPHHFGGYELACEDTMRRFRAHGHDVWVLTSTIRVPGVEMAGAEESSTWRQLHLYWRDHVLLSPPVRERLAIERRNQRTLDRALAAARPDVVSVWNMGAQSLGLLTALSRLNIPMVYVICDEWPIYARHLDAWSRLFRGRFGAQVGHLVERLTGVPTAALDFSASGPLLFASENMRQAAKERSGLSLPNSAVIHLGVDITDFPIAADDVSPPLRPWRWQLLYVGRIDERKGVETAIRALAELPEARLRVVGRGDDTYLARLHKLTRDLGLSSRVAFSVSERQNLADEYRDADVLIFPSVYPEPFGIVPLEAMACDTPVVATGTGGSGEYLVDGTNCLLYLPADHRGLATAIRRLAENAGLRRHLVLDGRSTARRLTAETCAEALLTWHVAAAWLGSADGGSTPTAI